MLFQPTLAAACHAAWRLTRADILASVVLLVVPASALDAQQATISGRVTDAETGSPLAGALVSAVSAVGPTADRQVLTDERGNFTLVVEAGRYSVIVPYVGHRTLSEAVSLAAGAAQMVELALIPDPVALDRLSVTAGRLQSPRSSLTVPAAVSVVTREDISVKSPTTYVDYLKELPGVDVMQVGITTNRVTLRGLNGIEGGADFRLLTDDRYANIPSQANRFWAIAAPPLDIDRIEVAYGPSSALYGPGSSRGVIQIITKSPIDDPGTSVSLTGGNRSIFGGAFRQAFRFSDRAGLKVTGQYFRGHDFEYRDPGEGPNPAWPLRGARDFMAERFGGEVRLDLRPWAAADDGITVTYGRSVTESAIDMVGTEAFQVKGYTYQYVQARVTHSSLFAQAFLNAGNEGDSYTLRSGFPFIERSRLFAAQAQYAVSPLSSLDVVTGVDLSFTNPRTGGTLHGAYEDDDNYTQIGGYLSATRELTETVDLVAALRADHHQRLSPDLIWSPRVGLVVEPVENHTVRVTYSRAYTPPGSDPLFLDLRRWSVGEYANDIPFPGWAGDSWYHELGGVATLSWDATCAGGVDDLCMRSGGAPGRLPADGTAVWDEAIVPSLLADPVVQASLASMGLTAGDFQAIVADPGPADMSSTLQWLDRDVGFLQDAPGYSLRPVGYPRPDISSSYEVGYQGLVAGKVRLSTSLYWAKSSSTEVWGVVTPTVFLEPNSVEGFVASRLIADGIPAADANTLAASVATTISAWPLGTVVPDQREDPDVIQTPYEIDAVEMDYWGVDVGIEGYAATNVVLSGSYSWLSKECFDAACLASLNAPSHKGSLGIRYDDPASGVVVGARARYVNEFEQRSGAFDGTIESYTILDANLAYRFPGYDGFIASLTVNNVFDNRHREAIGAPELGRILMVQLQYAFGNR